MATGERDTGASGGTVFPASGGATLARFDRPRGSGATIAVIADPHITPAEHGTFKVYHRTKQRFQMAVADAHRLDVDGVVVAGDLTRDGSDADFALAGQLLETAPEPTVAVPGNHDVTGSGTLSPAAFGRRYGYGEYPTTRSLGGIPLSLLDSTRSGTARLGGALDAGHPGPLQSDGITDPRVAVMHHPVTPVPEPLQGAVSEVNYRVQEPETTADALADAGVELLVTGHLHWPFATTYRGLRVVGAPGCSSFPPAYLLVHVDSRGTTVSIVPLADQVGLTEAYEFAVANDRRGEAIRQAVVDGYFQRFPLVEEWTRPTTGEPPASLSRTAGN